MVHVRRRRLSFKEEREADEQSFGNPIDELNLKVELQVLAQRFRESDYVGKLMLNAKVSELAFTHATSMCQPPNKVNTKKYT